MSLLSPSSTEAEPHDWSAEKGRSSASAKCIRTIANLPLRDPVIIGMNPGISLY